ncbi:MAG: T9SS type A sorting domain-containing protein [Bacteroidia bacterium]
MKKITRLFILPFIGLVAFATQASAQITITQNDMPTSGLTVVSGVDSTSGFTPTAASSSAQTWNFSTLKAKHFYTTNFMLPSATAYASVFTSATLADSTLDSIGHYFFDVSGSQFAVVGSEQITSSTVSGSTYKFHVEMPLSPAYVQSYLPATYTSPTLTTLDGESKGSQTFNQSIGGGLVTAEKANVTITYWDTIDAWGTLTTPKGTFPVLRQSHWYTTKDSLSIEDILGSWSSESVTVTKSHEYDWYTNGAGYILAQMVMDTTSTKVEYMQWDTTAMPTGINELSNLSKVTAFPNPCSSQITFMAPAAEGQFIHVYDVTGRELSQVEMKNGMNILNTASFADGMYLYTLEDKNGNIIDRGKFIVR